MKTLNDKNIRPRNLLKNYNLLYQNDLQILKKNQLVSVNCPACDSKRNRIKYKKMGFNFVICKKCITLYVTPRPTESSLEEFYSKTKSSEYWNKIFKKTKKIRKEKIFKPRIKMVFDILNNYNIKKCKNLVEVGAGYGWFCELAKKEKLAQRIIAIEPSHHSAEVCRKIKGIHVIESTIEKNIDSLHSDLIVSFESIHLLFNPRFFLKSCYNALNKKGIIIFSLTNYMGFDIQILQEKSNYIIPTFLNMFNPNSIKILLESVGFRKVKVMTPGMMDVNIVLNYMKEEKLDNTFLPFLNLLQSEKMIDDLQFFLQKNHLSSHMVVSAQK